MGVDFVGRRCLNWIPMKCSFVIGNMELDEERGILRLMNR